MRFLVQIGLSKVARLRAACRCCRTSPRTTTTASWSSTCRWSRTSVGYSVIAPPGVPDATIAALRNAFDATMKDPEFLAGAKKCCVDLNPGVLQGRRGRGAQAINSPKSLLERFITATGS